MSEWKEPNTKNKSKVVEDFMQMKDTLEVMITNLKKTKPTAKIKKLDLTILD